MINLEAYNNISQSKKNISNFPCAVKITDNNLLLIARRYSLFYETFIH
jgi:hypothetical protein